MEKRDEKKEIEDFIESNITIHKKDNGEFEVKKKKNKSGLTKDQKRLRNKVRKKLKK